MECDDDIIASFCFPFLTMVKGRLESTTILVASAEVKGGGDWHWHQADVPWWLVLKNVGYHR